MLFASNLPTEYSTHDMGDPISSPTRRTNCRQNLEMIFHPSEKKFAFFFATNLIPSSKTHFSRRSFGIKRYIIEVLYFLDLSPPVPQQNYLETQCPPDFLFFRDSRPAPERHRNVYFRLSTFDSLGRRPR
jgi:hypothetical protein